MYYSDDSLRKINGLYLSAHTLDQQDLNKVNALCARMEAERSGEAPQPTEGDQVICLNPTLGEICKNGHLERTKNRIWINEDPEIPFVYENGHFSTSGGPEFGLSEDQFRQQAECVGKSLKPFHTWEHLGPCGWGSVRFQCEVFLWKLTDARFSHVRRSR